MTSTGPWHRYVAIGDSYTEGMSDADPEVEGGYVGWADRLAVALAGLVDGPESPETPRRQGDPDSREREESTAVQGPSFAYANLAIRGRLLADIAGRQLEEALALAPDLVSIVGGGNDILRPRADIDALAAQLEAAVARIRSSGANVLLSTPTDPRDAPVLKHVRGRHATYTAHIWSIARRHGCTVIDLWGLTALQDWRMWGEDRIHLSTQGHERVAQAALAALGHGDVRGDWTIPLPDKPMPSRAEQLRADREWAGTYVRPWVQRRLTGRSSGDGRAPKRPTLRPAPSPTVRSSAERHAAPTGSIPDGSSPDGAPDA